MFAEILKLLTIFDWISPTLAIKGIAINGDSEFVIPESCAGIAERTLKAASIKVHGYRYDPWHDAYVLRVDERDSELAIVILSYSLK